MKESIDLTIKFFQGWNFDWVILFTLAFVGIGIIYIHLRYRMNDAVHAVRETEDKDGK